MDTALKQLRLASGETVDYDKLILCTGGRKRNLAVPGATLPGVYLLRTVAECDAIRQVAKPGARAVVVGMGFIGSEVAASLRQMGLEVSAVLPGAAPLAKVLGNEVSAVLAAIHLEHGVHLVTNDQVIGFEGGTRVERVVTAKGAQLACDLVVVGIGIAPAVDALAGSAITLDNGILLTHIFLRDPSGRRPVFGSNEVFQTDPHWHDYLLFHEYFHGDSGAGLGASHQTGWKALVAKLLEQTRGR